MMIQKLKKKMNYKVLSLGIVVAAAILAFWGYLLMEEYESSVLAIYADQQDTYVQLVLDQINIQPNRSDEEIVTKILGSLDTSNRKYWTLSKEQALLFVKDVTETNRYKGFTTATYFVSDSAIRFMDRLELNQVHHEIIEMEGERYVASGVIFSYNGASYKICLLTNETVILDNNAFLSSKIALYIFIGVLLIALLLVTMILNNLMDQRAKRIRQLVAKTEGLNRQVEVLEEKIEFMDYYHTRWNLYKYALMDSFIRKLSDRKVHPIVFLQVHFETRKERNAFLEKAQLLLDEKVLRFSAKNWDIYLVFMQYQPKEVKQAVIRMQVDSKSILRLSVHQNGDSSLWDSYQRFLAMPIRGTEQNAAAPMQGGKAEQEGRDDE